MTTEPVLHESELRARVIQRLEDGRLPVVLPTRINAAYGTRMPCDLCDRPIAANEVEYEVTDPGSGKRLHFHIACHYAWRRECEHILQRQSDPRQCSNLLRG